ncbi:hypothetical protein [Streptomyces olivaceoviridis]
MARGRRGREKALGILPLGPWMTTEITVLRQPHPDERSPTGLTV